MTIDDLFALDEQRTKLIHAGQLDKLQKTYQKKINTKNINTSDFWTDHLVNEKEDHNPMRDDRIHTVSRLVSPHSKTIFNIGVGDGRLEQELNSNHPGKLFGMDITTPGLTQALKKAQFTALCGSVTDIPINNKFDTITILEVLEHLLYTEIFTALGEIKRLLSKKGELIISVPINETYTSQHNPNGHMRRYSIDLIKTELNLAGYKVIHQETLYAFNNFYDIKKLLARTILPNK